MEYYEVKTYTDLVGTTINGIVVTERILESAKSKCIGDKRRKKSLEIPPDESDAAVLALHVQRDDLINAIASVANLKEKKPDTSIKFDDVRNMDLGLDNLEGYTNAERDFVQQRLCVYKSFYFGDSLLVAPNDEFQILDLINMELDIMQLNTFIRMNKKSEEEKKLLKEARLQYSKALQDLNVKKQQRDNRKKTETADDELLKAINEADKNINEYELEVDLEDAEEQQQMKEKKKRDKQT